MFASTFGACQFEFQKAVCKPQTDSHQRSLHGQSVIRGVIDATDWGGRLVWNHTQGGRRRDVALLDGQPLTPIVNPVSWHRRLTRGRGASAAGISQLGRGDIVLFLDSGIWQGLEGLSEGGLYIHHTPRKNTLLHWQDDTATLERGTCQ